MAFHETSNASSNRKMAESRVRSDLGAFKAASSLARTLSKSRKIISVRFILERQNIFPGHRSKSGFQLIEIHQLNRADGGQCRDAFGQHLPDLIIRRRRGKSNVQIRSPAGITARKRPEDEHLPADGFCLLRQRMQRSFYKLSHVFKSHVNNLTNEAPGAKRKTQGARRQAHSRYKS